MTTVAAEVLGDHPARYRVHWDDGRTSIISPSAGAATIARQPPKKGKAAR
jgi:hypothetical protein